MLSSEAIMLDRGPFEAKKRNNKIIRTPMRYPQNTRGSP